MAVLSRFSSGLGALRTTNEGWIFGTKSQSQAERGQEVSRSRTLSISRNEFRFLEVNAYVQLSGLDSFAMAIITTPQPGRLTQGERTVSQFSRPEDQDQVYWQNWLLASARSQPLSL